MSISSYVSFLPSTTIIVRPLKNAQFWSRSRKARILTTGIYRIFRVPPWRDEPDAEIGQISADFERGRFAKVS